MRVLLFERLDARRKYGGDLRVVHQYGRELRRLGCEVVISDRLHEDYTLFDIVHFTNLHNSFEIYLRLRRLSQLPRPPRTVLMPLHHKMAWMLPYYRRCLGVNLGAANDQGAARFDALMTAKDALRYAFIARDHPVLLANLPAWTTAFRQKRYIVAHTDALVVHTRAEADAVENDHRITAGLNHQLLIGREAPRPGAAPASLPRDYLLSVGRIEPLKNQLALVQAARRLSAPIVFVGAVNRRHRGYARRFAAALRQPGVVHLEVGRDRPTLDAIFQGARLHVMASWMEVFPMTTVEAACAGCRVVTTQASYEQEVYGDCVRYVDPADVDSIAEGIAATLNDGRLGQPDAVLARVPTWDESAGRLLGLYQHLLHRD